MSTKTDKSTVSPTASILAAYADKRRALARDKSDWAVFAKVAVALNAGKVDGVKLADVAPGQPHSTRYDVARAIGIAVAAPAKPSR